MYRRSMGWESSCFPMTRKSVIDSITALENFILGFRLGVRLMAECMDENDGDIRTGGE